MNAVERLEAAVAKLESLRRNGDSWVRYGDTSAILSRPSGDIVARHLDRLDGALIVTLHDTIDAQLAILRDTCTRYADKAGTDWKPSPGAPAAIGAIALADAILGGAS